jgi:hypothetical protein
MSIRTIIVPLVLLVAIVLATPVHAQWRTPTLSVSISAGPDSIHPARRPLPPSIPDERSWRERNAVNVGLLVGGAVGFGLALRNASGNDFRCPAEMMVPCWIEFPLLTAYGAGIGGFFGWIFSMPVKPREGESGG